MPDEPRSPMPPLGPPYAAPSDRPPPPRYPQSPPDQWSSPPVWIPPYTPPPREPWWTDRRRAAALWGGVAALIAIVIVGTVVWSANQDSKTTALVGPTISSNLTEPPTTSVPQDLDAVVLEIERFVERERGLTFKQHMTARLAADAEFRRRILRDFGENRESLLEAQEVLIAVELVPPGTDVAESMRTLLSASAVGFYDPETDELLVRGGEISPYVRTVLAHELTHALDDQWFDLHRPQLDDVDDETDFGFVGLVEGDAVRVQDAYRASMSRADQADAAFEEQLAIAKHPEIFTVPQVLLVLNQTPYQQGPVFVHSLLAEGGQPVLDRAFARPPASSEQIFDPQRYIGGEVPIPVQVPTADAAVSNTGVLGYSLLQQMFADSGLPTTDIAKALEGWGGDSYVTWTDSTGKTCLRDAFVGDTQNDSAELVQAVTSWASTHGAVVDGTSLDNASFTICN